jgi:hypothetical protein
MLKSPILYIITGLFLVLILSACGTETIEGSGIVVRENREVRDFEEIEIEGIGEVLISQGEDEALSIQTDNNLLEYIRTKVSGNTLRITFVRQKNLVPSSSILFYIYLKDLTRIESTGAGIIRSNALSTDELEINSSGLAKIDIRALSSVDLSVNITGAGDIELSGKVEKQNIEMSGVGNYTASNLESQDTVIKLSGIGNAVLWVERSLEVEIQGKGDVSYLGNPEVDYNDSGFGDLKRLGDK